MLEESVIYQDIFKKGQKRGRQEGVQEGLEQGLERERKLVARQLERLLGKLSLSSRRRIAKLNIAQVEALGEALLGFKSEQELNAWLREHSSPR